MLVDAVSGHGDRLIADGDTLAGKGAVDQRVEDVPSLGPCLAGGPPQGGRMAVAQNPCIFIIIDLDPIRPQIRHIA
ncbi:hypothetical protein GCM10020258_31150 [Sphingomonas yabuuchiae]